MSDRDRVDLDTARYYADLKDLTSTQELLVDISDGCLSLMDLIDNSQFTVSYNEAAKLNREFFKVLNDLRCSVKDGEDGSD